MWKTMSEKLYKLSNDYTIKVITDMNSLNHLRPIWDELLENHRSHVPFLCFDWFSIWLNHFKNDNKLLILQLQKKEKTVAIAPFVFSYDLFKGLITVNKLS
jgi:CelD/BcsL family acetyltransferase involved in cellulose biosynthesis